MREKYATFDCYGTLIDWRTGIQEALTREYGPLPFAGAALYRAYAEAELEQETTYKKYREVLSGTARELDRRFGLGGSAAAATRFADSVPTWPAFRDTAESLRRLGALGYKRYILSNVDKDMLNETIERTGLEIEGSVTAEETGSYKPKPNHWLKFWEKTSSTAAEELHVAQSVLHDVAPAEALGVKTVWVNRYREALPRDVHPGYVCESLADLVDLLGAEGKAPG
ncbi:MAG TPA: HAD-IA family hydrolase [Nitrososphaerales archaeon]|nr:HAD-IA family hydrolase [Nitrososphaerales archaeon]